MPLLFLFINEGGFYVSQNSRGVQAQEALEEAVYLPSSRQTEYESLLRVGK